MIFPWSNISFVILIDNFILPKLHDVDKTVQDRQIWLMLSVRELIIFPLITLYTRLWSDMFSLGPLITLLDFINLSSFIALFALIVTLIMRQQNTFFGIVLVGILFVTIIPYSFVCLALLVLNGPHVFCIVVGSNTIVITGSLYLIIWILLTIFKPLCEIPTKCFLRFSLLAMLPLRYFVQLPKPLLIF